MTRNILFLEVFLYAFLSIFAGYGIYIGHTNSERFLSFVQEDGFVEYLTAIFLFFASIVCLFRISEYRKQKQTLWVITSSVLAIMFFFGAGEEISWGQRIFNFQSGEFFIEQNKQGETNLHNLVFGDFSINKVIFSYTINLVLVIYFLLLRYIAKKVKFVGDLINKFNIPLPQNHHAIMMIGVNLLLGIFTVHKMDELHEFSFAIIFFLIFLNPLKKKHESSVDFSSSF